MDQVKIGKFIASERKRKQYTQRQLAEILGVSDKTISKWECGNGFPEISLVMPLCNELEITVNDLLSGERVEEKDYISKAEENMVNLVREAQESKKKMILSGMVIMLSAISSIPLFVIADTLQMSGGLRAILIGLGLCIWIIGIGIACVLDRDAGAFECPKCQERFVPEMTSYIMAPHTITKRKLKCPRCGETHYCKHVLTK